MYLFVFIFLIMSVLGLYTELFTLRMSQITASQKAVAQTMMVWHGAAQYFAVDNLLSAVPANGCSLTQGSTFATPCAALLMPGTIGVKNRAYLPSDYVYGTETKFETRLFQVGHSTYLITFVDTSTTKLGFTQGQIMQQMRNAKFREMYYGVVATGTCIGGTTNGTWLMTNGYVIDAGTGNKVQACYSVMPSGGGPAVVPVGAVGIVSIL